MVLLNFIFIISDTIIMTIYLYVFIYKIKLDVFGLSLMHY